MASKTCFALAMLVVYLLATGTVLTNVEAAGACGRTPIRSAALSLSPCLAAGGNPRAKVPPMCCTKVNALITTAPKCLCAVLLSPIAIKAGIKPAIAIGIPKRCNIKRRPVGKKCGRYIVP
ncbi:bifunctional inhibitor/lipid-transfer protein/seed storage 2S albumin superfamily protein [Artemisia annua]|uniref:Bifunctional inhibitor/lipid-transfer protein/seed storage 2S albumin superfamily protein n=1 Tax=Artemisia annua TaxID=35608 RepID=A0A2U1MME9_ARTAN|nr:bifunctional inhibitor/lipid-transfer protein/seed storage 2S albumin superfamily protein [Artemisia annua]